jgi:hypothetical protein
VVAVVGQVNRVVPAHVDAVRLHAGPAKYALAPGPQEIAFGIEHRNRMLAAIKGIDPVLTVDPDRGDIAEHDLVGQLRPILVDLEAPFTASELYRPASPPLGPSSSARIIVTETQIRRARSAGVFL